MMMLSPLRVPGRAARVVALAGVLLGPLALVAVTPVRAEAQLGWVKKALGMKKKKKPAPPPAAAQTPGAPNAAAGGAQAGAATTAPAGTAGAATGTAAAGAAPGAPGAQAPDPAAQRQAEKDTMIAYGRRLDSQQPQTLTSAKERLDYWESLKLSGMLETEVFQRYQQALRDYDQLKQQDSLQRAKAASANDINAKIERGTRALQARDLDAAETSIDEVLATEPNNTRALVVKDQIVALQKARRFKIILVGLGVALLALGVGAAAIARKVLKKEKAEDGKGAAAPAAAKHKALIKVVDGVGRGKLFTVEGDVFRIGAAQSDRPEEHNDIILSDSASAVSRFHCSIIRRGKDYFLVDSSLNGTEVNDKRLGRGEHHRLGDGDEFTIAAVSRLKFLRT